MGEGVWERESREGREGIAEREEGSGIAERESREGR